MCIRSRLSIAATLLAILSIGPRPGAAEAKAPDRPNIIIIMADDMGFSDIGCYGGEIRTPNLDRLAADGLRFTQFYNNARCCPTRATLLSGLYPHQAGIGHMMEDRGSDAYRGELSPHCVTIAQVLNPAGYRTYAVGKWHVTKHIAADGPKGNWPLQRGFDRYYGTITGAGSFFDPTSLVRDNTMISAFADPEYRPKTYYYTDAIADHAVKFLGDHARDQEGRPFFMYVAFTAAHWPMHALPEDIARYEGKYDRGYAPIREARLEKAARLGLIEREQGLTEQAIDWDDIENHDWESSCMEVYAAMVDRMDQGVGKIVAELRENGQLENTLILFLQDNGGCAEQMGRHETKGHPTGPRADRPKLPPMPAGAFHPGIVPDQTRDGYPVRQGPDVYPGPADTYVAYGQGWANTSNTPFREYKHWTHEGGISTPLIAHWPATIGPDRRNQLVKDPSHLLDLMATCVDLAGADYPEKLDGRAIRPMEGISLRPALEGRRLERPGPIFWEHEGNRAVRLGKWKLVAKDDQPWELYDMERDRNERHDLAAKMTDKVEELSTPWEAWARRVGVRPWPLKPANAGASKKRSAR